eukprot:Tbor_TRINITY_DN9212_c0_g1::TRINITY_DN9212_c0_g1_i1::g.3268::m.3268
MSFCASSPIPNETHVNPNIQSFHFKSRTPEYGSSLDYRRAGDSTQDNFPESRSLGNRTPFHHPQSTPHHHSQSLNIQFPKGVTCQTTVYKSGFSDDTYSNHHDVTRKGDLVATTSSQICLNTVRKESQDRHFIEMLFIEQEEMHERSQWMTVEAHHYRMMQMSFSAPIRVVRMEAIQQQKMREIITEFEVGDEVLHQRRRMDDRIKEIQTIIKSTNHHRIQLEEKESGHKKDFERKIGIIDDECLKKKRYIDELSRQLEFASIHSRKDDFD